MKKRISSMLLSLVMVITLLPTAALADGEHAHCICGANHADVGTHEAEVPTTFTAVTTEAELRTAAESGSDVCLANNIELNSTITVAGNLNLCLNGYSISPVDANTCGRAFLVSSAVTFNLTDCTGAGAITGFKTTGSEGGAGVRLENGAKFNMYGGKIINNIAAGSGGGILIYSSAGEVGLYGGSITGNQASNGGGVYAQASYEGFKIAVAGSPVVQNNTNGYRASNCSQVKFEIVGPLTNTAKLSIDSDQIGYSVSVGKYATGVTGSYESCFVHDYWDSSKYVCEKDANGNISMFQVSEIIFNANGGSGTMTSQKVPLRQNTALNRNTFTPPTGKEFSHWSYYSDGSGNRIEDGGTINRSYADPLPLYAIWGDPTYKINKADAENGSFSVPATAAAGATVTITPIPDKGYKVDTVKYNDTEVPLSNAAYTFTMPAENVTVTVTFKHWHPVCGSSCTKHDHSAIEWEPWSNSQSLPQESGHYYLTTNVSIYKAQNMNNPEIANDKNVVLCLNGFSITPRNNSPQNPQIGISGSFTMTDCHDSNPGHVSTFVAPFHVKENGKFTMFGGIISGCNQGVFVNTGGSFTMHGGKITENTQCGVRIANTAAFTMTGGSITGNPTKNNSNGGGIYVEGAASVIRMSGTPVVSDNTCWGSAQNITLNGARIEIAGPMEDGANICLYMNNTTDGTVAAVASRSDDFVYFHLDDASIGELEAKAASGRHQLTMAMKKFSAALVCNPDNAAVRTIPADLSQIAYNAKVTMYRTGNGYQLQPTPTVKNTAGTNIPVFTNSSSYWFTMPASNVTIQCGAFKYQLNTAITGNGTVALSSDSGSAYTTGTYLSQGEVVQVKPAPAVENTPYEVKVHKAGDSNTTVPTDDIEGGIQFEMPNHPVTVSVTFKGSTVPVTGVTLSKGSTTLAVGETESLTANVAPADATDKTVTWTSSDETVATVTNGVVTAVKAGTATITAIASGKTATCEVTVTDSVVPATYTVTFNANGGSVSPTEGTTGEDGKLTSLPTPTRSGRFSFKGWYTAASGGTKITAETVFESNTTIYAQWTYTGGSSSSGSSGGSHSGTTTTTKKNPDGSTTTTTTNKTTGTVTETTRTTDGTTATTVTDKNGNITEISAKVPASASGAAEKAGKPVTVPVEVSATKSSEEALPVKVDVPANGAAVEIPVENVTPGTVVVIVNADGSETVVSTTALTGTGVVVTLEKDATIKVVDNAKAFTDVPATSWTKDAVDFASARGITEGTSETTFSPAAACTRAQMVTFLWRAAGCPEPSSAVCDFTDVNVDSYYGKAVLWAIENGITNGTRDGSTFSPDAECSRAQMAAFLCRMADGKAESAVNTFADVKDSAYYAEAVQWAVENGITNGTGDNKFSPDATCTRGQMVTFLYRYYVK